MKPSLVALTLMGLICSASIARQANSPGETSREFPVGSIRVDGDVESPVTVDLQRLPLRTVSVRELETDTAGNHRFKGAFSYSGYSLYDILSSVKIAKKNQKEFGPSIDIYFLVANEKGERAVFSWGEVFYARDHFRNLISKSVTSINPTKLKTQWKLPEMPRLICAGDLSTARSIANPTRITVKSFSGTFPSGSKDDVYSPAVTIVSPNGTSALEGMDPSVHPRKFTFVGYGHGMGNKGVSSIEGYPLKEAVNLDLRNADLRNGIAVVSAKDGYRAVFSVSEIWNRNDMDDILLIDRKDSKTDGRYTLFVPSEFFVDRNVKAVERIQIVKVE